MEKTATFVEEMDDGKELYHMEPPLADYSEENTHEFVIVSAVVAMFSGPETYIFPADVSGEITDWGELPGSFKGELSVKTALENAGYTVVA